MKSIRIDSKYVNKLNTSFTEDGKLELYMVEVKFSDFPEDLPLDPNPRNQNINKNIYKEQIRTAIDRAKPPFALLCQGVDILAEKVNKVRGGIEVNFKKYIHGVVNGGHTTKNIVKNKDVLRENPEGSVFMYFITGLKPRHISTIAKTRNTSAQVKDYSIAELEGHFDSLHDIFKESPYSIRFKENSSGNIPVKRLLQFLMPFSEVYEYGREKNKLNPMKVYQNETGVCSKFLEEPDKFTRQLAPIALDILDLACFIEKITPETYNAEGGKAGALKILNDNGPGRSIVSGERVNHKFTKSMLLPILCALKPFTEFNKKGEAQWIMPLEEVKTAFTDLSSDFLTTMNNQYKDSGNSLDKMCKVSNMWELLHSRSSNYIFKNFY